MERKELAETTDSLPDDKVAGGVLVTSNRVKEQAQALAASAEAGRVAMQLPELAALKAKAADDMRSMLELGLKLQQHQAWHLAYEYLCKAAKGGLPAAMHQVGLALQYGWGCERSEYAGERCCCGRHCSHTRSTRCAARRWYYKAAQAGDADAQFFLAKCLYHWVGHSPKPWTPEDWEPRDEAAKWMRAAAEGGNAFAQNELGYWCVRVCACVLAAPGFGCAFVVLLSTGRSACVGCCAIRYWVGLYVGQKPKRAVRWWIKAAGTACCC
jgi:TPR repeat protein